MMRHAYPLQADEAVLWPRGEEIPSLNGHHLGRRILDSGLNITWGDGQHWVQVNEPTSPRSSIWRLRTVCWLSVSATVLAPPPGCYAAFFRIRQPDQSEPLLEFSAEWKAAAITEVRPTENDVGFLKGAGPQHPPALHQECEASASWTHRRQYHEANPGGWLLLHVGNIMVRESSEAQQRAAAAEGVAGGTSTSGQAGSSSSAGVRGRHVVISFGGDNPGWARNLDVDFAAIAPLRLSWGVERVLMIGNRKGHISQSPDPAEPELIEDKEELDRVIEPEPGVVEEETPSASSHDGCSPLSRLPGGVMLLVLEFSQPTLVRPQSGLGRASGVAEGVDEDGGHWEVF